MFHLSSLSCVQPTSGISPLRIQAEYPSSLVPTISVPTEKSYLELGRIYSARILLGPMLVGRFGYENSGDISFRLATISHSLEKQFAIVIFGKGFVSVHYPEQSKPTSHHQQFQSPLATVPKKLFSSQSLVVGVFPSFGRDTGNTPLSPQPLRKAPDLLPDLPPEHPHLLLRAACNPPSPWSPFRS